MSSKSWLTLIVRFHSTYYDVDLYFLLMILVIDYRVSEIKKFRSKMAY